MSERRVVRMDLTPGSWTGPMALSEDFDTAALAGRVLPMKGPGGEELGEAKILKAEVIDGRLLANVSVPESLAELLTPKLPGMFGDAVPFVQRARVRRGGEGGVPHELGIEGPTYVVDRYGGTYSIRKAIRCGFRSRRRVQGARALARTLWGWREQLLAGWESHWEQVSLEDRQRACPHPVSRCYRPDTWTATEGAICEVCAASVPWHEEIAVQSAEERMAAHRAFFS